LWLHACHFEIKQKHRVLLRVAAKMVCLLIFANVKSATKKKEKHRVFAMLMFKIKI